MTDEESEGESEHQVISVEKFPEHLIECPDLLEFSYERFVKIGRKFRSANEIIECIDEFIEELQWEENQEGCYEILKALEEEKQIIRFSIYTKNNVIVI